MNTTRLAFASYGFSIQHFSMHSQSKPPRQHFFAPRNVGDLSEATGVGTAGSLRCGGAIRFSVRVDETRRIAEAKFKAAGCSYLVACSSLLTERVCGMTCGEAAALAQSPKTEIFEQFGSPPYGKEHCATLACDAVISAIRHYSDAAREEWSGEEALICSCFGVSERTIEREVETGGLHTIAEVTQVCNAGAGCRSCYSLIEDILDDHWRNAVNSKW